MDNINMEPIYKMLINNLDITDETLRAYGYSEEDICMLLEKEFLERLKTGEYKITSVEKFRQYGISLLENEKKYYSNKCFEKCYELAPNGKNIALQYIYSLLKRREYQKIFPVIDKINSSIDEYNYNLYLYLLSFFIEFPDTYKDKIKNFSEEDLLMPISRANRKENNVRRSIINSKFKLAYKQSKELLLKTCGYSIKFELIKELLKNVITYEEIHKEKLLELTKKEQYKAIVQDLKERQEVRYLSFIETYILIVAESLVEVLETRQIPVATIGYTPDIYQALRGKNFEVAKELNDKFAEEKNVNKNTDVLNLLLTKLTTVISRIKFENDVEYFMDNKDINDAMEMAYYIKQEDLSLEDAIRNFGLKKDLVLLIKLIYAKDYYIEGNIPKGDLLLKEVEDTKDKSYVVLSFINEVKAYRDNNDKDGILKLKLTK